MRYHSEETCQKLGNHFLKAFWTIKGRQSLPLKILSRKNIKTGVCCFVIPWFPSKFCGQYRQYRVLKWGIRCFSFCYDFLLIQDFSKKNYIFTFFFSKRIRIYPRIFEFPPIGDSHGTKGQRLTVCKSCDQILRRGSEMYFLAKNWSFFYTKRCIIGVSDAACERRTC